MSIFYRRLTFRYTETIRGSLVILTGNLAGTLNGTQVHVPRYQLNQPIYTEDMTSLNSITNFFHDDPNVPYTRPPERTLEQSPCYPIIATRQGYFYCRLHPEIKNIHLESIVHNLKYKIFIHGLKLRSYKSSCPRLPSSTSMHIL